MVSVTVPAITFEVEAIQDLAKSLLRADATDLRASIKRAPAKKALASTDSKTTSAADRERLAFAQKELARQRRVERGRAARAPPAAGARTTAATTTRGGGQFV